jgi:outer membrane receptor protein involved in Fe transport
MTPARRWTRSSRWCPPRATRSACAREILPGWQSTLSLWRLNVASELLFVGDAGTTEASRPSNRHGIEWNNFYAVNRWLALDADLSLVARPASRIARPKANYIPGAVETTANIGVTVDALGPWFGALRLRYFGARALIEDNSVRSAASSLVNLRIGYRFSRQTQLALDVYNLLKQERQ